MSKQIGIFKFNSKSKLRESHLEPRPTVRVIGISEQGLEHVADVIQMQLENGIKPEHIFAFELPEGRDQPHQ